MQASKGGHPMVIFSGANRRCCGRDLSGLRYTRKVGQLLGILLAVLLVSSCTGEPADTSPSPVGEQATDGWRSGAGALADSRFRVITSEISGRTYEISIALPRGYADSEDTYPVLYTTDANGQFGTVVETVRILRIPNEVPELIVVGLGYPRGRFWNALSPRATDLTPTVDAEWVATEPMKWPDFPAPESSGGASAFLQFVTDELVPMIDRDFRTKEGDRALLGHSFGGLFATYALLSGDKTFNRYLISSPSYWWDNKSIFAMEESFSASGDAGSARIFFSVGLLEQAAGNEAMAPYQMVSNLQHFINVLKKRPYQWDYDAVFFPDENHNSVFNAATSRGLRYLYRK